MHSSWTIEEVITATNRTGWHCLVTGQIIIGLLSVVSLSSFMLSVAFCRSMQQHLVPTTVNSPHNNITMWLCFIHGVIKDNEHRFRRILEMNAVLAVSEKLVKCSSTLSPKNVTDVTPDHLSDCFIVDFIVDIVTLYICLTGIVG